MTTFTYPTTGFFVSEKFPNNGFVDLGVTKAGELVLPISAPLGGPGTIPGVPFQVSNDIGPSEDSSMMVTQADGHIIFGPTEGSVPTAAGVHFVDEAGTSYWLSTTTVAPT